LNISTSETWKGWGGARRPGANWRRDEMSSYQRIHLIMCFYHTQWHTAVPAGSSSRQRSE